MSRASGRQGPKRRVVAFHKRLVKRNTRRFDFSVEVVARVAKIFQSEDNRVLFRVVKLNKLSVKKL